MKPSLLFKPVVFCLILLSIRAFKTGHLSFYFLLWNLFLAWLPYCLISGYDKFQRKELQFVIIGLTILFLPNAPYILTDLFHLTLNLRAPLWFDLILILSFSLLGLLYFILTTDRLFAILAPFFGSRKLFNCVKFLVILSNGYGIYLGRYLRFNSWDVISNPDTLLFQMYRSVFDRNSYKETLSVTFTFTIFLYLVFEIYESVKKRLESQQNELS